MNKTLHPSTQILKRNTAHLKGKVLLVNPPETASIQLALETIPKKQLTVSCQDYGMYKAALALELPALFETYHVAKAPFDTVVVFLPKSDLEIEMVLSWARSCVKAGGHVILIGQNNAGIKSAKKTLEKLVGPVVFSDTARHSAFYVANKSVKLKPFSLNDWWLIHEVASPAHGSRLTAQSFRVFSLPGTFSHGRLDDGTSMLLATLPDIPEVNPILDWGCGSGTIGAALSLLHGSIRVDMVDSNALALASSEKTVKENKLKNCRVFASNIFSDVTETYEYIVANPPFHKGRDTYYADVESFLTESSRHLAEHGHLRIVANNFLNYEASLEKHFGYVKTLVKNNKYKIVESVKTPAPPPMRNAKAKKRAPKETKFLDVRDIDKLMVEEVEEFEE